MLARRPPRPGKLGLLAMTLGVSILFSCPLATSYAQTRKQGLKQSPQIEQQTQTAVSGRWAIVMKALSLNPDCTVKEVPEVYLKTQPAFGDVIIEVVSDYYIVGKQGAFAECNNKKVFMNIVRYKSPSGFIGQDKFEMTVIWPMDGEQKTTQYIINVR